MLKNNKYKNGDVETWDNIGLLEGLNDEEKLHMSKIFGKIYRFLDKKQNVDNFINIAIFPIVRRIYNEIHEPNMNIKYIYDKFKKYYKENTTTIAEINIVGADGEAEIVDLFSTIMAEEIKKK